MCGVHKILLTLLVVASPVVLPVAKAQNADSLFGLSQITYLPAVFPFKFSAFDYTVKGKEMPAVVADRIKKIVVDFYYESGGKDESEFAKEKKSTFFRTLCFPFNQFQLFVVILQTPVSKYAHCRIFLYDPGDGKLSEQTVDYNIWSQYDIAGNQMNVSDLVVRLRLTGNDLETMNQVQPILRLNRLNHNGTFNALEHILYSVNKHELVRVSFESHVTP